MQSEWHLTPEGAIPMPDKHEGCKLQFTQHSRAWYARQEHENGFVDEVMVGMYHPDGGTTGEFAFRWMRLSNTRVAPCLVAYHDSWDALNRCGDLLAAMARIDVEDHDISPNEFCRMLISLGIEDATQTEGPYPPRKKRKQPDPFRKPDSAAERTGAPTTARPGIALENRQPSS